MLKILILLTVLSFNVFASGAKPIAVIYHGPGTCKQCPEAVAVRLIKIGYKVKYIYPGQFSTSLLKGAKLYVQPGGSDEIEDTLLALKKGEIANLQEFVSGGGHYLGICAGGYLAGKYSSSKKNVNAFNLIPIDVVDEEIVDSKAVLLPVMWNGKEKFLYSQSSPSFGREANSGAIVVARFSNTQNIAAMILKYGKGVVGVIGPHPEADSDWYSDDNLTLKHGLNFQLFDDFVKKMEQNR